jgi:hypothetical protein
MSKEATSGQPSHQHDVTTVTSQRQRPQLRPPVEGVFEGLGGSDETSSRTQEAHPKQEWREPRLQQWCVRKVSEAELAATRLVLPEPHLNGAFSIGSNGSF